MNINNSDMTSEIKSSAAVTDYANRESGALEEPDEDLRLGSEQLNKGEAAFFRKPLRTLDVN